MNYIFLLLGNDSFYDSIIMSKLADDMHMSAGIFCITGQLQTVYFADNQKIFKLEMGSDMAENKKLFEDLILEGEISAIFIFDFYKFFFKTIRPIIQFDIKWLENLNIPVNLVDYLDMFDYNNMDQLYLKNSARYNIRNKTDKNDEENDLPKEEVLFQEDTLEIQEPTEEDELPREDIVFKNPLWPNIIKLSPPYPVPEENKSKKILYWKSSAKNYLTDDLERMKGPLSITETKQNVMLIFSYQMIFQSFMEKKQLHYMVIIYTIITYLKKLDIEMNLFVVGFDAQQDLVKGSKIKLKSFKLLNHGLYKTLTTFANIIITDTPWHPILLDAAELQIPAGVIGNSLNITEDGTFESGFESTDPDIFRNLEIEIQESPNIFFPYIAFPLKIGGFPEFAYNEKKLMYYLLDIYSDENVMGFLGEFLITQEEVSEKLKERQEIYSTRAENALNTEALLLHFNNV